MYERRWCHGDLHQQIDPLPGRTIAISLRRAVAAPRDTAYTNGSERDIRLHVTKRKVSGTRNSDGRDYREAFLGLVVGEHGRLGCANHRERDTCTNRRTVLRDQIMARVFVGLKDRLLAPEPVEIFVTEYVAEVNLSNRNASSRRSKLETDLARVDRRIRTMVDTIADTGGSRALVEEARPAARGDRRSRHARGASGTASQPRPDLSSEG